MVLYKILTVGDGQVGKTTLLKLISNDVFKDDGRTVLFDFHLKKFDDLCQIIFFDIAGQESEGIEIAIKGMTNFILGGVNLIFLMFDQNNMKSLLNIANWYEILDKLYKEKNLTIPKILLLGNKNDLVKNVSQELVNTLLENNSHFVKYMETSCITRYGIPQVGKYVHEMMHNE